MTRAARLGLLTALVAGSLGGCSIDDRALRAVSTSPGGQSGDGGAAGDGDPTTEGGGDDNPSVQGGGDAGSPAGRGGAAGLSGSSGQGGGQGGVAGKGGAGGKAGMSGSSGQGGAGTAGQNPGGCDKACTEACKAKYPDGNDGLGDLLGCIGLKCEDQCPSTPDCQSCQETQCAGKIKACTDNPDCSALLQCLGGASECAICQQQSCKGELSDCDDGSECLALYDCLFTEMKCDDDAACQKKCVDKHPEGLTPLNALSKCLNESCTEECPPSQ